MSGPGSTQGLERLVRALSAAVLARRGRLALVLRAARRERARAAAQRALAEGPPPASPSGFDLAAHAAWQGERLVLAREALEAARVSDGAAQRLRAALALDLARERAAEGLLSRARQERRRAREARWQADQPPSRSGSPPGSGGASSEGMA